MKTKAPLKKWRGVFNLNRTVIVEYCYAVSKAQAKSRLLKRIADRDGVPFLSVFQMFNQDKDNYEIKEEP